MQIQQIKQQRARATLWGELELLCKKIHHHLYDKDDKSGATRYRNRLRSILVELPKNDLAILRAEGLALLHELNGEIQKAIKYRKKEIKLVEKLHDSVRKSVQAKEYDEKMAASILHNKNKAFLSKRLSILEKLQKN